MAPLCCRLIALILLLPSLAGATPLLELESQEGELGARLTISGATLLTDDQGQPLLTAADELACTLVVTAPAGMTVTLPDLPGPGFGDFTLLDQGEISQRRTGRGLEHERQWLIEPYNPGPYQLPELLIRGQQGTLTTELILARPELVVQELTADGEELDDILPPLAPTRSRALAVALAAAALALLALGGWLIIHRRHKGPRPLPPKERALAEMALMSGLAPRAQVERLAFILRCYLTSRFGLQCLEQTYDEYGPTLAACAEIPQESRALFLAILERCDLIKFSNLAPEPGEPESMADQIKAGLAACPLATPDDKTCGRW